jgi:hypothetical protein
MQGSIWDKVAGQDIVFPSTIVSRHYGAWSFDMMAAIKHEIATSSLTSTEGTLSFSSAGGAIWLFESTGSYNLPDTYWETDASGNINFTLNGV